MVFQPECKANEPCIFKGRELGWEKYKESESYALIKPTVIKGNVNDSSLYLTMSSFRDKLCPSTLFYLFTKAAHPSRVTVGVVQQNAADDVDCLDRYCEMMRESSDSRFNGAECPFKANVRILRVDAKEAKGPTWARSLGSKMMQDEEFCMQTDSHMDFVPDWDVHMIEMWAETNNEYAVLSTYVADSATLKDNMPGKKGTNGIFEVPHLCMVTFSGSYGMVRNWGTKCLRSMHKPKITNMVWGAGLSFSKCHAERKAPYDPHTPHIFDGEEFARAIRFWTWGYDIYTPHRVYVVHNYRESQSDPKHSAWAGGGTQISWEQRNLETQQATRRLRMLLEMPSQAAPAAAGAPKSGSGLDFTPQQVLALQQSRYGLGDRRTLDQAIAFSGIDTKNRKMLGNYCGNLDFIPFVEHPWGPEYIPRFDNETEAFLDARDPGSIYFDESMRAAWEEADRVHQLNRHHQVVRKIAPILVPPQVVAETVEKPKFAVFPARVVELSINSHREKPRQEMVSGRAPTFTETLVANKLAVNLICLALIALVIFIRVFMDRYKIRKSVVRTIQAADVEHNTMKEV